MSIQQTKNNTEQKVFKQTYRSVIYSILISIFYLFIATASIELGPKPKCKQPDEVMAEIKNKIAFK